jgi:hypothetical protein
MKSVQLRLWIAGAACFCAPAFLFAHHSISAYYAANQRATIQGTLVEFNFRNPHSFVELDVPDQATGMPVRWAVEWSSSERLRRQNISKDTLKSGDPVVILGQPSRNHEERRLHMLGIRRTSDGWSWGRAVE